MLVVEASLFLQVQCLDYQTNNYKLVLIRSGQLSTDSAVLVATLPAENILRAKILY